MMLVPASRLCLNRVILVTNDTYIMSSHWKLTNGSLLIRFNIKEKQLICLISVKRKASPYKYTD